VTQVFKWQSTIDNNAEKHSLNHRSYNSKLLVGSRTLENVGQDTVINSPLTQLGLLRRLYHVITATIMAQEDKVHQRAIIAVGLLFKQVQKLPLFASN
jgi:hypothetical protein